MKARKGLALGCVSSVIFVSLGCASTPPPRELLDARAAYNRAASGPASQVSPASLHDAKVSLARAERAYSEDEDPTVVRDVAYVAQRKAEMAEADAATISSRQQAQVAMERARMAQAQSAQTAQGQLAQARSQLATTSQELERERQGREEAEKRAQQALDQLAASGAQVRKEERGTVITMPGEVLFASGHADLMPGAKAKLDRIVDVLKQQGDHQITIEGHTDSRGTDALNMDLSQRRAESVRDYLVSRGLTEDKIKATGKGESSPVATNDTAVGRAQNRRVELVIEPLK